MKRIFKNYFETHGAKLLFKAGACLGYFFSIRKV